MSKERAIAKLIPIFRQYGYEGATLKRLSQATGLGKASLYHHFPNGKEGMAAAVLEYIGSSFKNNVLNPLMGRGEPAQKLQKMCRGLKKFYSEGKNNCFLEIMSVGEADSLFHQQLKWQLITWTDTLANVLVEAEIEPELAKQRSQDAIGQIQGALVLVRILDDTTPFERVVATLPERILQN